MERMSLIRFASLQWIAAASEAQGKVALAGRSTAEPRPLASGRLAAGPNPAVGARKRIKSMTKRHFTEGRPRPDSHGVNLAAMRATRASAVRQAARTAFLS